MMGRQLMGRSGRRRNLVAALAVAGLVFAASGVGIAATRVTTSPTVHACAAKKSGVLTIRNGAKCPKGTKAVNWATKGPAGRRGAKGARGPKGNAGAAGSAAAWVTVRSSGAIYSWGGSAVKAAPTVTRLSAGDYCIVGKGYVEQGGPYALTEDGYNLGGSAAVNPYFIGNGCTSYNVEVLIENSVGTPTDDYFTLTLLAE